MLQKSSEIITSWSSLKRLTNDNSIHVIKARAIYLLMSYQQAYKQLWRHATVAKELGKYCHAKNDAFKPNSNFSKLDKKKMEDFWNVPKQKQRTPM